MSGRLLELEADVKASRPQRRWYRPGVLVACPQTAVLTVARGGD